MEIGRRIQEWRRRLRWEQKELANRINVLDRRACCDNNMVSRWECGRNMPGPFYQELLCAAFAQADDEAIAGKVPDVDRRAFIRHALGFGGASLLAAQGELPWDRIQHALENPGRIDLRTIQGLERVTISLERLEQQVGPLELIGPAAGHYDAMAAMLRTPMPAALRPMMCSIAAETAGLLAVAKAQTGHVEGAATYIRVAFDLAREAKDRALGAWLMGRYTCAQPAYRSQPELRLRHFVDGAFGFGAHEASPPARAWFSAKAADVYALIGRPDDCLRALDRAEAACRLISQPIGVRPRHAFCDLGEPWLAAERGASLARLGHCGSARQALDTALRLAGSDLGRVNLWLLLAKARTYIHDNEPNEAARLASEAVGTAEELHFDLIVTEVRKLYADELSTWPAEPEIAALGQQVASR